MKPIKSPLSNRKVILPLLEKLPNWLSDPAPDYVFEISELALAGVSPRSPERLGRERLAERGLSASPSLPNILRPQLYRDALPKVLGENGVKRPATALVIPDYAVRMAILDFEQFPSAEQDRLSLLRFRLRKTVPFHIEEARVSYAIQESKPDQVEVLAVAVAQPILLEYESIFTDAGHRVGLVVPSLVASLRFCEAAHDGITLFAKSAGVTLSMGLVEAGRLRLVRCLDLGDEYSEPSEDSSGAFRALQQTLAFAEDQLEHKVNRILLCGFGSETNPLGAKIEAEFGIPFAPAQSRFGTALAENAGMLGLLEQYTG